MTEQAVPVITRVAPSPTGFLHVGTARTALFNYLFARNQGGAFLVRIEDTDRARSRKVFEKDIMQGLRWLGVWKSAHPSVRQSERAKRYRELLQRLINEHKAYLSAEESKREPGKEVQVVRLRNPGGVVTFNDIVRGTVTMEVDSLGDMVIARSLEEPLYHFAVVVDDADMGVTHVVRGEDHISNTPRQILIQEALRFPRPQYAHLPLLLAPDRSKLSKRYGAVSISEYRRMGYLPEALVNYLALLGWNPGTDQELFGVRTVRGGERTNLASVLEDLAQAFSLNGVQKGGAIFNLEKLNWFNAQHLRRKTKRFQLTYIARALADYENAKVILEKFKNSSIALEDFLSRVSSATDIARQVREGEWLFYELRPMVFPEYNNGPQQFADLLVSKVKLKEEAAGRHAALATRDALSFARHALSNMTQKWKAHTLERKVREHIIPSAIARFSLASAGSLLWPLRVALSGRARSPSPFVLMEALGREETGQRLFDAANILEGYSGAIFG
ncbi:MAG: glutamate--tRNA ligase 1 [Candidatus Parcubacteria bacterium]|nr:MAG: glutamate--tRNA ligase 1 [Candidatus Parcubacteria bacterium]